VEERENIRSTSGEDAATESAVLQLLLALHPIPVTVEDVVRETGADRDPGERDALDRALRELTGAGLIHRSGDLVLPSRAAVRFDELMER